MSSVPPYMALDDELETDVEVSEPGARSGRSAKPVRDVMKTRQRIEDVKERLRMQQDMDFDY